MLVDDRPILKWIKICDECSYEFNVSALVLYKCSKSYCPKCNTLNELGEIDVDIKVVEE